MKLGYVIIYVKNVLETIDFYKKAFKLKTRFIHESNGYAEMETGQTALAFVDEAIMKKFFPFRQNRSKDEPAGIEITFVTETVEKDFEYAVKSGAVVVEKPSEKPWGQTVSYVRDNNGCLVEICSPVSLPS